MSKNCAHTTEPNFCDQVLVIKMFLTWYCFFTPLTPQNTLGKDGVAGGCSNLLVNVEYISCTNTDSTFLFLNLQVLQKH